MTTPQDQPDLANDEVSLNVASSVFAAAMESSTLRLSDPNTIKDELSYLKEFFSKLKFQYLEQETRDRFLRLLLLENNGEIQQEDVDALVAANAELKRELKLLKLEMVDLVKTSEGIAEEVIAQNRTFESLKKDVDDTLGDIASLQGELDGLLNAPENENYKTLFNLQKMIDTDDIGLSEALGIASNALEQEKLAVSQLELDVERAEAEIASKDKVAARMAVTLQKLLLALEQSAAEPQAEQDPQQAYAQWLRELNALLVRFIPAKVEFESAGGLHTLKANASTVTLDDELNVVLTSDASISRKRIEDTNCATGTLRFWKLLQLLSKVILQA